MKRVRVIKEDGYKVPPSLTLISSQEGFSRSRMNMLLLTEEDQLLESRMLMMCIAHHQYTMRIHYAVGRLHLVTYILSDSSMNPLMS